jgi:hypothetical protein
LAQKGIEVNILILGLKKCLQDWMEFRQQERMAREVFRFLRYERPFIRITPEQNAQSIPEET